jgi:enoyl-CoA hydratase/carnithine racemase
LNVDLPGPQDAKIRVPLFRIAAEDLGVYGALAFVSRLSEALVLATQIPGAIAMVLAPEIEPSDPDRRDAALAQTAAGDAEDSGGQKLADLAIRLALVIREAPFPVVVAQRGVSSGLSCLMVLMADGAVSATGGALVHPYRKRPGFGTGGAAPRLVPALGPARAFEFILLGELMPVVVACDTGLIDRIGAPAHVIEAAVELASELGCEVGALPSRRRGLFGPYNLPTGNA